MERATLGQFIAALRKDSGMTQKQLAEILNVSDKTISHWERDESSPDLSMIPIIARVFGVTCDELLGGERREKEENKPPKSDDLFGEEAVFEKAKSFNGAYNIPRENKPKKSSVNEMTLHKILCAVAAGICAFALFRVESYVLQLGSLPGMNDMIPGFFGVAFFFSVCIYFVISAVILSVSHVKIKSTSNAEEKKEQLLVANKFTAYAGLFLCLSVVSTVVQLIALGLDYLELSLLIMLPAELIAAIITVVSLKHKRLIASKQRSEQARKNFKLRLTAFITVLVFVAVGVGVQIGVGYFQDLYGHGDTYNSYKFIEYMETYKPFPEEYKDKFEPISSDMYQPIQTTEKNGTSVFRIDVIGTDDNGYVLMSLPDSGAKGRGTQIYNPFDTKNKNKLSFADSYLHEHPQLSEKEYEPIYCLSTNNYDDDGNRITLKFKWKNHEVKCFEINDGQRGITVYTYKTYRLVTLSNQLSNITYRLAFVYYPAVVIACIAVCIVVPKHRRKRSEAEE